MSVVIVDTACANLASVKFAFERLGVTPRVSADSKVIQDAERVVLPGVGTAKAAMRNLQALDLITTLQGLEQPVLGICLGMQLMTQWSAEGNVDCLGLIPARTVALENSGQPLPHMGWNTVAEVGSNPLLAGIDAPAFCYFVHSYAVAVDDNTIASTEYGQRFASMIRAGNFFGAQFHPERSGAVGAQILKNFMELSDVDTRA
jgi:glutamine amidotransferase